MGTECSIARRRSVSFRASMMGEVEAATVLAVGFGGLLRSVRQRLVLAGVEEAVRVFFHCHEK